jgi:hypothetical protein
VVELLYFVGCPNHEVFLPHLRQLIVQARVDAQIELRRVESPEAAERERFLGSPTVRVDGRDVDPSARERDDYGLKCRLYRTDEGLVGIPPDEWVLAALMGSNPGWPNTPRRRRLRSRPLCATGR